MMTEEIQEQYADELEAFHIWMKDAGYTGHTVKSYTGDVVEFLVSIQGKSLEQVKERMCCLFCPARGSVGLVMPREIANMRR